jgi:hypothetical protein
LSAQPFELIEVSAGFDFYNGIEEYSDTGIYDPQDFSILNGRFSSGIDNVGFNNKLLNYSYSIQQSVEPIYVLSESYPSGYSRSNGQITISVQGTGIADAVDFPCADLVTSSITLGSTCGESFTISTTGLKPEKVSIQAQVGAQMVGSVDLIKFF